jgi:hypothetical protein
MTLKINEQTALSRLRDAKGQVTQAGLAYDVAKRTLTDFNDTVKELVQDARIEARRAELCDERDRLFHVLQEAVALVSFYESAMPPRRLEDWKKHERANRG